MSFESTPKPQTVPEEMTPYKGEYVQATPEGTLEAIKNSACKNRREFIELLQAHGEVNNGMYQTTKAGDFEVEFLVKEIKAGRGKEINDLVIQDKIIEIYEKEEGELNKARENLIGFDPNSFQTAKEAKEELIRLVEEMAAANADEPGYYPLSKAGNVEVEYVVDSIRSGDVMANVNDGLVQEKYLLIMDKETKEKELLTQN